jgi:hypothetical protein
MENRLKSLEFLFPRASFSTNGRGVLIVWKRRNTVVQNEKSNFSKAMRRR